MIPASPTNWPLRPFFLQNRRRPLSETARYLRRIFKRITEDFAVSFGSTWTHLYAPGGHWASGASGFQNSRPRSSTAFKNAEHDSSLPVGLNIEWAHGAQDVGADRFTVYTPTFYFGKALAICRKHGLGAASPSTGQVGYAIPSSNATMTDGDIEFNPRVLVWGASLQYSLP